MTDQAAIDTETMDKLYLEWSQFTKALTRREIVMMRALRKIADLIDSEADEPLDGAIQIATRALDAVSELGERGNGS